MNFNDLSDKEKKLVVLYKYDPFRDKSVSNLKKRVQNASSFYDKDYDLKDVRSNKVVFI